MCDSIYCAYILIFLCIVLYMFFYEANKDDYYKLHIIDYKSTMYQYKLKE